MTSRSTETSFRATATRPTVAVIGRPNVGKSTLFNRLIRRRRAITDPTPGVTRDAVEAEWWLGKRRIRLLDTGGYTEDTAEFGPIVAERSLEIAHEADLLLLVMDVTAVVPEDETYLERLASLRDRVILVVNKVDNEEREHAAWDFYRYGFADVVSISAEHGRNVEELTTLVERRLSELAEVGEPGDEEAAAGEAASEQERLIKLAVLGRPNTGKSTLANALTGRDASLVSEIPGTTRDVVEGEFDYRDTRYRILDTAGMRRKQSIRSDVEYYSVNRAVSSISEADVVLLLVEADSGLAEQDKKIARLVVERGRGLVLVLSKWDLMSHIPNALNAVTDRLRFMFPIGSFAPIVPVSAVEKSGFRRLLETAYRVNAQLRKRVGTGELNRALAAWTEETPPPYIRGKRVKLYYITQVEAHPLVFVLFVSRARGFPGSYRSYIVNRIREEFGFNAVPIRLDLRESHGPRS
ncbi:MAG: ribosome biogenesis GTPase Der [Spirochaetaceae bacterium]